MHMGRLGLVLDNVDSVLSAGGTGERKNVQGRVSGQGCPLSQHRPFQVTMTCRIAPSFFGGENERCSPPDDPEMSDAYRCTVSCYPERLYKFGRLHFAGA